MFKEKYWTLSSKFEEKGKVAVNSEKDGDWL